MRRAGDLRTIVALTRTDEPSKAIKDGQAARLAPEAWLADPGRPAGVAFLEQAGTRWSIETRVGDVVLVHRLKLG